MKREFKGIQIPEYISEPSQFGVTAAELAAVYESPDEDEEVTFGDHVIGLYYRGDGERGLVVAVQERPKPRAVVYALRVFADLCESPLAEHTPLDLTRRVVGRFGLNVTIGERRARFFLRAKLPRPAPRDGVDIFDVSNPEDHGWVAGMNFRVDGPDVKVRPSMHVTVAFFLDTTLYHAWVGGHAR